MVEKPDKEMTEEYGTELDGVDSDDQESYMLQMA